MARMDVRLRAWAWFTRKTASIAGRSDEQVIALQAREMPDSKLTNWLFGEGAPGGVTENRAIAGPGGDIPVRVYRRARAGADPSRPLVVYFHGGGFVFGALRMGDWLCGQVATQVGAVVVSVDYRLAPTHRFPAAVDDCYAALEWAARHAADAGGATGRPRSGD